MKKICPDCENGLEEDFKFCPECGKTVPATKKVTTKKKARTKNKRKLKFTLPKITLPKIPLNLKVQRKTVIAIISIVCLATIVGAGVMVTAPFEATIVKSSQGRMFAVTVENDCGSEAVCHLKVGALKYGESFSLHNGETTVIEVYEDGLFLQEDEYEMTLYAKVYYHRYAEVLEQVVISGVTEFADFSISKSTEYHSVECTEFQ